LCKALRIQALRANLSYELLRLRHVLSPLSMIVCIELVQ